MCPQCSKFHKNGKKVTRAAYFSRNRNHITYRVLPFLDICAKLSIVISLTSAILIWMTYMKLDFLPGYYSGKEMNFVLQFTGIALILEGLLTWGFINITCSIANMLMENNQQSGGPDKGLNDTSLETGLL